MFTGIVETVGTIAGIAAYGDAMRFRINTGSMDLSDVGIGDSIAVSGPCLTVTAANGMGFDADVSTETLARTTLGTLSVGDSVNLEKALRVSDRLGGHLVSGHIDGIGIVTARDVLDDYVRFVVEVPRELSRYLAYKGSVAMDGVSLTVNQARGTTFEIMTIPHTLERTTLGALAPRAAVNVEVDLIARYIERLLSSGDDDPRSSEITREKLRQSGFLDGGE